MDTRQRQGAHRITPTAVVGCLVGASAWAAAGKGLRLLPASAGRLAVGIKQSRGVYAVQGGCGIALGLFGWAVTLSAAQGLFNGLLYPLVDAHDYQHSWGGPTLVGAWVVHAAVAVPVAVAALGVLRGMAAVDRANEQSLSGRRRRWWPLPLSGLLAVGLVLFFIAWLHQV